MHEIMLLPAADAPVGHAEHEPVLREARVLPAHRPRSRTRPRRSKSQRRCRRARSRTSSFGDGALIGRLAADHRRARAPARGRGQARARSPACPPRDRRDRRASSAARSRRATTSSGSTRRWKPDDGYALVRDEFKKFVPGFVVPLVRRDTAKKLHAQGTGRHTLRRGRSQMGAGRPRRGRRAARRSSRSSSATRRARSTARVFAFLDSTLGFPLDTPLKQRAASPTPTSSPTAHRIRERWWKDLPAS